MMQNSIFTFTGMTNTVCLLLGVMNLGLYLWLGKTFSLITAIICFVSSFIGFYLTNKKFNKIIKKLFTKGQ